MSSGDGGSNPTDLGTLDSTNVGYDVYAVRLGEDMLSGSGGVALVDDTGTVLQFVSFNGNTITATEGAASGLTSTNIGSASGSNTLQSTDGGASYSAAARTQGTIPCFGPGTLIAVPGGRERAVEDLVVGDLVRTIDAGPRPIRWISRAEQCLDRAGPEARPVLIGAGALGPGRPERDLVVSPQHRVLVGESGQLCGSFDGAHLVPAKALTGLPGIRAMMGKRRISWFHFALDRQEVVIANGCLTESLLLGPMVLAGLAPALRGALVSRFGGAAGRLPLNGSPARPCLSVGAARRALAAAGHCGRFRVVA